MADFLDNPFVNAGMGLGGGLGAMPVALPYTTAGAIPGGVLQYGGQAAVPYMAGLLGGAGTGAGAMAMQPDQSQQPPQQSMQDKIDAMQADKSKMDAYKTMAQGIQGMGRNMQMQMPSGNTAQIIRDSNQFRFAGNPQQQMAQALRNR